MRFSLGSASGTRRLKAETPRSIWCFRPLFRYARCPSSAFLTLPEVDEVRVKRKSVPLAEEEQDEEDEAVEQLLPGDVPLLV